MLSLSSTPLNPTSNLHSPKIHTIIQKAPTTPKYSPNPPPLFPFSFSFSKSPSSNTKFQERTKKTQPNMILQFPILFLLSFSNFLYFSASQSIYGALKSHGLPMGLFPKGIKDYQLDAMGNFTVFLDRECNAKFENELHYDRNVSGRLLYGQIANLTGVSAQDLFLWFPVKGIRVDVPSSGLIYFDVGVVFKQFSVSLFETPRDCLAVEPPEAAASKSQYGKLRYRRDPGDFGRAIL